MTDNNARIRRFLSGLFSTTDWSDSDDIFERGFVNSLIAMQLVLFVEKEFGISVDDEDLEIANFSSVNAISDLVRRKTEAVYA